MYDGGKLLRRLCFILSEHTKGTPVSYWLEIPLSDLMAWVECNNSIIQDKERALKKSSRGWR
jgi:hypothetical protein